MANSNSNDMKKYIVLSVNDNPDYLYFVPLTVWAWRKFGWVPVLFYSGHIADSTLFSIQKWSNERFFITLPHTTFYEGYRSDTISQMSRLYAACVSDGYLMTGDIDMIPLSDYWRPSNGNPTVWGYDLTGYSQYPICYIGMTSDKWKEVMKLDSTDYNALIKRDLDSMPQAKDKDFYKYWFTDQELITKRLKPYKPTIINRGQYSNGFARGRVDRGAWTLDHKEFIDCHMHHQIHHKQNDWKFKQTLEMLHKIWPDEDFTWYIEYHNEFKRLTGHE